jgi:hypothetical protein
MSSIARSLPTALLAPAFAALALVAASDPAFAQGLQGTVQEKAQDAAIDKAKEAAEEQVKDVVKDQMGGAPALPGSAPGVPTGGSLPSVPGAVPDAPKPKLP